jgi:hypothetical protein
VPDLATVARFEWLAGLVGLLAASVAGHPKVLFFTVQVFSFKLGFSLGWNVGYALGYRYDFLQDLGRIIFRIDRFRSDSGSFDFRCVNDLGT